MALPNRLPNPIIVMDDEDQKIIIPVDQIPRCCWDATSHMIQDSLCFNAWTMNNLAEKRMKKLFKFKNWIYDPITEKALHFSPQKFSNYISEPELFPLDAPHFAWHFLDVFLMSFEELSDNPCYIDCFNIMFITFRNVDMFPLEFLDLVMRNTAPNPILVKKFKRMAQCFRIRLIYGKPYDVGFPLQLNSRFPPNPDAKWTDFPSSVSPD